MIVDVAVVLGRGKLFHASLELKDVHLPQVRGNDLLTHLCRGYRCAFYYLGRAASLRASHFKLLLLRFRLIETAVKLIGKIKAGRLIIYSEKLKNRKSQTL